MVRRDPIIGSIGYHICTYMLTFISGWRKFFISVEYLFFSRINYQMMIRRCILHSSYSYVMSISQFPTQIQWIYVLVHWISAGKRSVLKDCSEKRRIIHMFGHPQISYEYKWIYKVLYYLIKWQTVGFLLNGLFIPFWIKHNILQFLIKVINYFRFKNNITAFTFVCILQNWNLK